MATSERDHPPAAPWQVLLRQIEGLAGKNALVTGASSGIGRELALALAQGGARLGLVARRRTLLETVAADIARRGGDAWVLPADVTDPSAVRDAFAEFERRAGSTDIVINNAGIVLPGPVTDMSIDDLDRMLRVNLVGALLVMQEAIRRMRAGGGGSIVNVGSLAGRRGVSPLGGYCATKFGLIGLTEALRMELRSEPIHVSLVLPGFVDTAMVDNLSQDGEILDVWPSWLTMPPSWVVWAVIAALRFRLVEVSVPPGSATLEKIGSLAPGLTDAVLQWTKSAGHWLARLTRR
jgi:NAD(P)-dependent dehydrogenase (short-subunit alcohol dehydrogenase family)